MAKRTLSEIANVVIDMADRSREDATFKTFVEEMAKLTFQEIAAEVPHARWLLDEDTVTTTANQQYVSLPSDMDIDAIVSARVEDDQRKLVRISPSDADRIDPGRQLDGEEIFYWFQRVGGVDRLYFMYKPDSVDTINFIFGNIVADPASNASFPLPAKYESYLIAGTLSKVWERLDPENLRAITRYETRYENGKAIIRYDANRAPDESNVMVNHRPFLGSGIHGATFPADFDVLP